jgi:hypothetical protein
MTFKGIDTDIWPGAAALADLKAQGFSWTASYLEAPSHSNASWPTYAEITASGLSVIPLWVGGQITGPGSHLVSGPAGAAEATSCVNELQAKGYPAGHGVAFDTENGAPVPQNQTDHLTTWRDGVRSGGFRAMVYCSHVNQAAMAAIFGAENVWCWDLRAGSDQSPIAPIVQYQQNTTITAAGQTIPCDLDVSLSEDPAGVMMAQPIIATPIPAPPMTVVPTPTPTPTPPRIVSLPQPLSPPVKPTPTSPVIQHGPLIAAAATAVAAAGAGATGATTHMIDFTALINALAPYIITGVVLPLAIWLAGRALQYFNISTQSSAGQAVVGAVQNGVNALAAAGVTYADAHANVDVHDAYLASVLSYANSTVPARIAASGITPAQLTALATNRLSQIGAPTP